MLAILSPWWEHLKTDSCTAFSPLLLRGVPVGVVYAGNNVIFKTRWFPPRSRTDSNGRHTVRSRNAFDDENARPVPYSQVVFPVLGMRYEAGICTVVISMNGVFQ